MSYSGDELTHFMTAIESDLAERKGSFSGSAPETTRQAVCAFANDLPNHRKPGVVFVGVADDGMPTGLPITDQLLLSLADIKTDGKIVPPPTLTVQSRNLRGKDVAVITVTPSDSPPVRYNGRTYIRIGPRRGLASAQDERILNEKRHFLDVSFDIHGLSSATARDLSARLFEEEYLPAAVAPDILEANERTLEQRLAATKMVVSADNPTPTVLGILVLGIRPADFLPGAYVQFLRIDGTELADPVVDESIYDGPVTDLIRRTEEKLESHNRVAVDFTRGATETRTQTYPAAALQQIVRNAVMHRTYESTNAPIRIYWFNDRIEIFSPGGPFGLVTAENFGQPGAADYRNPNLAEALRVLGFVQRFGAGIATAQRALAQNGNPPLRFETSPSAVLCRIERRP